MRQVFVDIIVVYRDWVSKVNFRSLLWSSCLIAQNSNLRHYFYKYLSRLSSYLESESVREISVHYLCGALALSSVSQSEVSFIFTKLDWFSEKKKYCLILVLCINVQKFNNDVRKTMTELSIWCGNNRTQFLVYGSSENNSAVKMSIHIHRVEKIPTFSAWL